MTASVPTKSIGELAVRRSARLWQLRDWPPALRYCIGVYLAVRVALILLAAAAWGLTTEHASVTPNGTTPVLTNGWHNAITGWNKQDSLWFLHIAQYGYSNQNASASFYPAYPLLIRVVGFLCLGHLLLAAYLVSNAALLVALVLLYQLTEREYDADTARRAVLYLCLFPTAFFLFDTYSEAVFLLFTLGAVTLARRGLWGWAGLLGIGATLTRSTGVVLVLALVTEAVHQTIEDSRSGRGLLLAKGATRLGASAVPLAGTVGYLLFWQLRYRNWAKPFQLEKTEWGRQFSAPWHTLWQGLIMAWRYGAVGGSGWWTLDFVLVAAGLMLGVWVLIRARPIYAVYTWGSLLFFLSEAWPGRPLVSDPRYLVTIFPLIWALARFGRQARLHEAIVAGSAVSMALVGWLFLATNLIF